LECWNRLARPARESTGCYLSSLISGYHDKFDAKERNFPQAEVMALVLIRKLAANLRVIAIKICNPLI
jgi:hypothetical protein